MIMWEIFADNTYLRATGNLVAVGTAIVLFYKSVRVGWGFFNTTIRSGVRAAIYRQKRRFYLTSYVCAFDVHVYISYVLRYMCLIFVLMFSIILFSNKNLKSEEYDGVEAKINQAMINMITGTTSTLLKLRLEKAILENSNQSILLNEEKYILDSKKEMLERKETILSGILNGKPHSLDV